VKQEEPNEAAVNPCDPTSAMTPACAALYRILGPLPQPRMLTAREIELLRQSAKEIAQVAREVLAGQRTP